MSSFEFVVFGKKYSSMKQVCEDHGVSQSGIKKYIVAGYDLEEAIEIVQKKRKNPIEKKKSNLRPMETYGTKFESVTAMARHYDLPVNKVFALLNLGHGMEETIEILKERQKKEEIA